MEAQLPHGYIYTTRARTIDDVREEAYWFYFVVSKYPPKLGAWIHFQLNVTSKTAVTILDKWYEYLGGAGPIVGGDIPIWLLFKLKERYSN